MWVGSSYEDEHRFTLLCEAMLPVPGLGCQVFTRSFFLMTNLVRAERPADDSKDRASDNPPPEKVG